MPADALIAGGGPAGAALAVRLARAGRHVVLLERTAGPADKVCGEFLSAETIAGLRALDVEPAALGAVPLDTVRLAGGRHHVAVPLPFAAMSLSRRTLDEALLARAAGAGADVRRGAVVRALCRTEGLWTARVDAGPAVRARQAFLATGKHDLRDWKRPPGLQADLIGLKMHWRLSERAAAELGRAVEIFLFPGGYAGLEPVEEGYANLCLVIRRRHFAAAGGGWPATLAALRSASPLLERRLDEAAARWPRPLAVAAIPYGLLRPAGEGPWRLGDQAAVVPSFSGTGIALALHSAALAAAAFLDGGSAADYGRALARDTGLRVRGGTLLSMTAVHPAAQRVLARAAAHWPGLLAAGARATRLPSGPPLSPGP